MRPTYRPSPRNEGLLGFEYVEPVPGVYEADRSAGKFGGVTIKVRTGRRTKR